MKTTERGGSPPARVQALLEQVTADGGEVLAEKVRAADVALVGVVAALAKRGVRHPYVKNYILSRTTPLTRQRKTLPSFDQTFSKLLANIEAFDIDAVRYVDIQRGAIMATPAE